MIDLAGLSKSELWKHANYNNRAAREFIVWLDRTHGPMGELITAMSRLGQPKELVMHPDVLFAFDRHLHVVDSCFVPSLSKYLPGKYSHKIILGVKVNTDHRLSCPVSPGRIVLDSIERYGVHENTRSPR